MQIRLAGLIVFRQILVVLILSTFGETFSPEQQQPKILFVGANASTTPFVGSPLLLVASSADHRISYAGTAASDPKADGDSLEHDLANLVHRVRRCVSTPFLRVGRLLGLRGPIQSNEATDDTSGTLPSTDDDVGVMKTVPASRMRSNYMTKSTKVIQVKRDTAPVAAPTPQLRNTPVATGRSATGSVDLSGIYDLIVDTEFKKKYDKYLALLGQPFYVRSVAVNIISFTEEEMEQSDNGRTLFIRGRNVRGVWERTLKASGPQKGREAEFEPLLTPIKTLDDEEVLAEAWWEENGTVHRSILHNVQRYGGGSFESIRYLEDNGNVFVCESIFHPNDKKKEVPRITWKFQRRQ